MPSKKRQRKAARKEQAKLLKMQEAATILKDKIVEKVSNLPAVIPAYKEGDHIEKVSDNLVKITSKDGVVHYKSIPDISTGTGTYATTGLQKTGTSYVGGQTWGYSVCSHWQDPVEINGHKFLVTGILGGKGKGVWPDFGIYLDYKWADYLELDLISWGSGVKGKTNHPVWLMNWKDYSDIPQEKFKKILDEIGRQWARGRNVIEIGCLGAHGRTGTVLAGLLIQYEKMGAEEAITEIRKRHCIHAVESHCQKVMLYELAGEESPTAPAVSSKSYATGLCGIPKCGKTYSACTCTQEELLEAGEISAATYSQSAKKTDAYCIECKGFVISCPHKTAFTGPKSLSKSGSMTYCPMCKISVLTCEHKESEGDYYCVKDGCHKFVVTCQHDARSKFKTEMPVQVIARGEAIGILCEHCNKDITFCDCEESTQTKCLECLNIYLYCACELRMTKAEWEEKNDSEEEVTIAEVHPMGLDKVCPECHMDILHCNCAVTKGTEWWEQTCDGCGRQAYGCKCGNAEECPLCELPVDKCQCQSGLGEWCLDCGKFQFMCECTGRW